MERRRGRVRKGRVGAVLGCNIAVDAYLEPEAAPTIVSGASAELCCFSWAVRKSLTTLLLRT